MQFLASLKETELLAYEYHGPMMRLFLIASIILLVHMTHASEEQELKPEDIIHPYQELEPQKKQNFFEIMEADQSPQMQKMQEDPRMRLFEDMKAHKKLMKDR